MNTGFDRDRTVLIVEDSKADRRMIEKFMEDSIGSHVSLMEAEDGQSALDLLNKSLDSNPEGEKVQVPDLILLDLDLPGLNGLQVLKNLREDESLCSIPVTVLATSDSSWTVREAYKLGASSYIVKPDSKDHLEHIMVDFFQYWFKTVQLPEA